jgi:hypothetical protein
MRFLHTKTDHIPVAHAPVRFGGGNHVERFQNIGLSLGIFSVENIGSLRKFHMERDDISEIRQFQTADVHKYSVEVNESERTVLSDSLLMDESKNASL